ncbi:MAG TPA: response regulator [Pyrinomonadaceae bacterium]|jgi:signal transduction histidine kinase
MVNVLLVDDEPSIRFTMTEFLKRAGYTVHTAANFTSAVELLPQTSFAAAVLDIHLPGQSGLDLLEELHRREPNLPVIMITGEPNIAQLPEIVRAGAYDFIAKPVVKDVLLKAVARAVEKKRLSDEQRRLEQEIQRYAEELEQRVAERTAELSQMQARLAHNEKIAALGRVAAQIAHEVKNPLAGLLLYAMHLRGKAAGKLAENEFALIDKIIETINHLTNTVEQVLSFARPVQLSPRRTDLNHIVQDVLQLLRPQLAANRIETQLALGAEGTAGLFDESTLRSALMNLMLNGVQAMPAGGVLTLRTEATAGHVVLEIGDTGAGMTPEQVQQIFEPFYTTRPQGLGLGMPYAQKIIEQHHGVITVASQPGVGTNIRIELPTEVEA